MEKEILKILEQDIYEEAKRHFINICGLNGTRAKQLRMLDEGMKSRLKGLEGLDVKAVIGNVDSSFYTDHGIIVEGKTFACKGFHMIDDSVVQKIYFYLLTIGEYGCNPKEEILTRLYGDIWGTAYTEAARDYVKKRILADLSKEFSGKLGKDLFLSETFGPGFYGMDVLKSIGLYELLEADKIGIQVRESGMLMPLKSCSGIFLAVTDPKALPHPDCRDCLGNAMSCSFCRLRENKN